MEAKIFIAAPRDRGAFSLLWAEYLAEHEKLGSDIRATDRSLEFFEALFDAYVRGALRGVVLVARWYDKPVAVLMWGELPQSAFDRVNEDVANGWGAYTSPDYRRQGVSRRLRSRAIEEMVKQGITTVMGTVILTNLAGVESSRDIGFKPTVIVGDIDVQAHGAMTDGFYWEGLCPLCGKE